MLAVPKNAPWLALQALKLVAEHSRKGRFGVDAAYLLQFTLDCNVCMKVAIISPKLFSARKLTGQRLGYPQIILDPAGKVDNFGGIVFN